MHSCIHLTLVSYDHKSSKRLALVSIWSFDEFSSLCLRFLIIKPISHLIMVCYHQNLIRRTLGLTKKTTQIFLENKRSRIDFSPNIKGHHARIFWEKRSHAQIFLQRLKAGYHFVLKWEAATSFSKKGDPPLKIY